MNNFIESKHISIIIQGPLYRNPKSENHIGILQSLPSIKKQFPEAELILSTWDNEDVQGLEVDKVVLSEDPGSFPDINRSSRNFNRQIISTRNGLLQATRPYVLKTRTDIVFTSSEITRVAQKKKDTFLNAPVTLTNMVFRNYFKIPFLFHPSDVIQFGFKEDLLDIWSIPLELYDDIATNGKKNIFFRYSSSCFKYHPEQSMCLRWLEKHGVNALLNSPSHISYDLFKVWEKTLSNNFHIVDYERSGIKFPPHFYNSAYGIKSLLTGKNLEKISKERKNYIKLRYLNIWMNKYLLAPFKKAFVLSLVANVIYVFCPSLNQKIFSFYRKIRPR